MPGFPNNFNSLGNYTGHQIFRLDLAACWKKRNYYWIPFFIFIYKEAFYRLLHLFGIFSDFQTIRISNYVSKVSQTVSAVLENWVKFRSFIIFLTSLLHRLLLLHCCISCLLLIFEGSPCKESVTRDMWQYTLSWICYHISVFVSQYICPGYYYN